MSSRPKPASSTPSSDCGAAPSAPSSTSRADVLSLLGRTTIAATDALLAALFAPPCAGCGAALDRPAVSAICDACWHAIVRWTPPTCVACGEALPSWRVASVALGRCPRCRRAPSALDRQRSIGPYRDRLRDILHAFKYDGRRTVARGLAALLRESGQELLDDADAVVPVPLHRTRRRARGFNQAADLAGGLGLPVLDVLRRTRATAAQVSLPAARRRANVRLAFDLAPRAWWRGPRLASRLTNPAGRLDETRRLVDGRRVVLVDDVCTTGATLEACARVLKAAGAAEVRALTAARVVTRPQP